MLLFLFCTFFQGFEKHVKREHCQWAYLFFFIHLRTTMVNDYSAIELYVHRQLLKDNINFFPLNRAMSLEVGVCKEAIIIDRGYYYYTIDQRFSWKSGLQYCSIHMASDQFGQLCILNFGYVSSLYLTSLLNTNYFCSVTSFHGHKDCLIQNIAFVV